MYQNSITDLPKLKSDNYANIFHVHTDEDNRYFYNLLQTIVLPDNLPAGYYGAYNATYGDTWPLVCYKIYGNPNLWWLIVAVNNIVNPTTQPQPGQVIKFLKTRFASAVISQLTTQDNE
jgi:nucleoid-associated protein YgaU